MKVDVRCLATLANEDTCDYKELRSYDLAEGETVKDLAGRVGVDTEKVQVAFVNGRRGELDTVLANGDRVGFVPAVGGM